MILVYTGSGKGKTSACIGQAIRALGQGLRVCFAQLMKSNVQAGEQQLLQRLLGDRLYIGGCGFFRDENERPKHKDKAHETLVWCMEHMTACDVIVLDEALYALGKDLITQRDLETLFEKAKINKVHVVLSGRGLPLWLQEHADLVTEMEEIKHPWQQGQKAIKGIDF